MESKAGFLSWLKWITSLSRRLLKHGIRNQPAESRSGNQSAQYEEYRKF